MSVKKKIDKNSSSPDVIKYITEGAKVRADGDKESLQKTICLRLPIDFLEMIDELVTKRVGLSRNAWILQVIQEKLEKTSEN